MTIYIISTSIILVLILLFILIKDKIKLLNNLALVSTVTGALLTLIGFILSILFNTFLNNFNITKISSIILNKFMYISIPLLIIGLIGIIISRTIQKNRPVNKEHQIQSFDNR